MKDEMKEHFDKIYELYNKKYNSDIHTTVNNIKKKHNINDLRFCLK